jgi:hypothetical protein
MSVRKHVALSLAGAVALLAPGTRKDARAATRPPVETWMAGGGWAPADIAAAVRGDVIARVAETQMVGPNDTAEVAVQGVVRVDVPRQAFIEAIAQADVFRNIRHLETGIIHNPPLAGDFAGVSLPQRDIKSLQECRPGRCALRLTRPGLVDLQSSIDWRSADAPDQANRRTRAWLLAIMTGYVRKGLAAFTPFEDSPAAVDVDEQFRLLLEDTGTLTRGCPELAAYLRDYPAATLPSSKETFYWALDDFGVKPTLTITQAVAYSPEGAEDVRVAWKQIYASHFFNAGLSVTTYERDGDASYVVQIDRVRADGLGGAFGRIKRGRMAGAMEGELKEFLRETRARLRSAAAPAP